VQKSLPTAAERATAMESSHVKVLDVVPYPLGRAEIQTVRLLVALIGQDDDEPCCVPIKRRMVPHTHIFGSKLSGFEITPRKYSWTESDLCCGAFHPCERDRGIGSGAIVSAAQVGPGCAVDGTNEPRRVDPKTTG
jgi:hypothetical protein